LHNFKLNVIYRFYINIGYNIYYLYRYNLNSKEPKIKNYNYIKPDNKIVDFYIHLLVQIYQTNFYWYKNYDVPNSF